MLKKYLLIFIFVSLIINNNRILSASDPDKNISFDNFIGIKGIKFSNDFKFIGANLDPWRFITYYGEVYSQNEIKTWVKNAIDHMGAGVIRMHINGGGFEPKIGEYNENAFKQLDYLIAACAEYKIYVYISLRDYLWVPWPSQAYDPYWFIGRKTKSNPDKDAIMTDDNAKQYFKNFISFVLNRVNTVTGTIYKNDKNIMCWEIINEPNIIIGITGPWLTEMAKFIKSIDKNHLISVATYGVETNSWDVNSKYWNEINIPQLDFIDLHYYADVKLYNPIDIDNVNRLINRINIVLSMKKPVIIGEFGCLNNVSLTSMINLYQTIIDTSFKNDVIGVLPFSWGPPGPNGWGGKGSYNLYIYDKKICNLLKNIYP